MEAFFRGSHTTNFVTCGFNRSYNQAAQVPSSNVTCSSPRSPLMNCRMMLAFVSTTHSSTILPAEFMTAMEMLSLWTSMPIYFVSFIGDAPFGRRWDQHSLTYSRGAPLYCVVLSSCGNFGSAMSFARWTQCRVPNDCNSCDDTVSGHNESVPQQIARGSHQILKGDL